MIFILILMWDYHGTGGLAIEFNDLPSCQAAAMEVRKQSDTLRVAVCAQKGKKP